MSHSHDRKDVFGGYKQETDKRYYNIGNDLYRTHCDVCMKLFSHKEQENMITPLMEEPIFVCLGQHKYECKHALCSTCHMAKLDNIGGRSRRRRKK